MIRLKIGALVLALMLATPFQAMANCAQYGATATQQQRENARLGCGFKGPRWHTNAGAHAGFCALAGDGVADAETALRAGKLVKCRRAAGGGDNANQARRCEKSEVAEGTGPSKRDARDAAHSQLGRVRAEMVNAGLSQCRYTDLGCTRQGNDRTCFLSVSCCER